MAHGCSTDKRRVDSQECIVEVTWSDGGGPGPGDPRRSGTLKGILVRPLVCRECVTHTSVLQELVSSFCVPGAVAGSGQGGNRDQVLWLMESTL